MLTITIKQRNPDNTWSGIPLEESANWTVAEIVKQYDGKELVMECKRDGVIVGYVCGNDRLKEHYTAKGYKSVTVGEFMTWKKDFLSSVPGVEGVLEEVIVP